MREYFRTSFQMRLIQLTKSETDFHFGSQMKNRLHLYFFRNTEYAFTVVNNIILNLIDFIVLKLESL
jgi:hypothetical protein